MTDMIGYQIKQKQKFYQESMHIKEWDTPNIIMTKETTRPKLQIQEGMTLNGFCSSFFQQPSILVVVYACKNINFITHKYEYVNIYVVCPLGIHHQLYGIHPPQQITNVLHGSSCSTALQKSTSYMKLQVALAK